jgi:signal peptidase I
VAGVGRRTALSLALLVGLTAGVALARKALLVVHVDGVSMLPTFRPGEAVLAVRRFVRPTIRRGDIVVCRLPEGVPGPDSYLVKRVAALAGEPSPVAGDVIPSGHVFVCGDGTRSYDSRAFGPIPLDHVVAHVVCRLTLGSSDGAGTVPGMRTVG